MGDEKDWQGQLLGAALMAAAKTVTEYVTNPEARDEALGDVRSKLAEVDYPAVARALSKAIDQFADSSKSAVNEAIDSLRTSAEDAVEVAAQRAEEQLGKPKRGKGRLFFGLLIGLALGFFLLNEERRNQLMDKISGASGPIDDNHWTPVTPPTSSVTASQPETVSPTPSASTQGQTEIQPVVAPETAAAPANSENSHSEPKVEKASKAAEPDASPESSATSTAPKSGQSKKSS